MISKSQIDTFIIRLLYILQNERSGGYDHEYTKSNNLSGYYVY